MIEVNKETFAGIECLHASPAGQRRSPLPTILFFHGFTSSKDVYSWAGVALALAGFRVILPDAELHGGRYDGDSENRLGNFWEILRRNIDEVPLLEAAIRQQGLVAQQRIALAGASMGGMTTLGAMVRHPHFSCADSLMGSGYFVSLCQTLFPPLVAGIPVQKAAFSRRTAMLADYDITERLEKMANRPLLLWHGDADELVPVSESQRLDQALRDAGLDENLQVVIEKGAEHRITPVALDTMVTFFQHHL
ncbi:esterase [Erwinia tracheiphila]|uniref:Esterase n=1 Tax=Erwinia tracheiphila TaxID=65700 RepID=A0A0M2KD37_9GAMM|nr:esterase [Erwinia tracheiphila]EOS95554.1 esterase [Erwinia tracheiphila PSU-1]KKF37275.1 esterase [Erwinia tracheiphila]UIA88665.1 esterase [Erwinia tracheiphila]UIA97046.1 esterase [Erwinia tracheiphila]